MNKNIENLVKSNEFHVDYYGLRGGFGGYYDCVDVVTKDDIKRNNIDNIYVRFMDKEFDGVAVRVSDGSMRKLVNGRPGVSSREDLGDITKEDIVNLLPIYNQFYLDKYAELFMNDDEWVEDMENEEMVGIRDDFSAMADKMDILLPYGVCGEVRKFN